mgnify:CR=1 FL=1
MPFYTGKSADGSDMKEFEGMFVNPDNDQEWSNTPYHSQQKQINVKNEVLDYMNGRFTLNDVRGQIINKKCLLSTRCRDYVMSHYDKEGNFIFY